MKRPTILLLAGSVLAGVMASTPALALKAFATAHLNIRTGPGEQFPIAGEMKWESHGVGAVTPVPAGTALIEAIAPEAAVIEYVKATPVAPVHVTGEIVVGAILPAELVLYEVPSSPYQYAVVNTATVLVEPASRKVVYIAR
jgi:hypothetical protein